MRARVPASSANLGPGFDTLAVALSLYVEVSIEPADSFSISSAGYGAGLFDDERHLGAQVARRVLGHSRFALRVDSNIPVSRGLGSSAALALAAAAAAGAEDPLALATEIDGHAENAAASMLGGLVTASVLGPRVLARPLALDARWRFVVVVPEQELATADARRVLPASVPFADAVHNLNALGLLIAGLADEEAFVAEAMSDVLHQPYRMGLLPFAAPLLATLRDAGARGACWSGAGSTMLALCTSETEIAVVHAARSFLADQGIAGGVMALEADRTGLVAS
ncbi:MAG TPA: homoserine kinase [Acidimicrobiales bacterium]|nr:homoserine kinase [Acidimicrobiales bacterium]